VTRARLPQRAGSLGLNGGGAAAAVPPLLIMTTLVQECIKSPKFVNGSQHNQSPTGKL